MKKQILVFNIFLFFIILAPLSGLELIDLNDGMIDLEDEIENISPPEWIHGAWILDDRMDEEDPFIIEFTENDIIMNYSIEDDIESGYIVAFIQNITADYYDIYLKYDDGWWYRERFFVTSDKEMESHYVDSTGSDDNCIYYKD